ncbi:FKBP-type peptidyl-prolyl cis-trans isomerase [Aestuariimicrobium kwangyangense]|uniref:FKBP-type peptidyl-prolyl cis-trans isomerase n=1 Tax=Aestuariimicrobium kwangyangense TaxID=396389 RepID=UPI0003B54410|nr:FKBP-type peptidyl-prolyl cis-trans isomerase [Aestuariimicrobium kwangyangense]
MNRRPELISRRTLGLSSLGAAAVVLAGCSKPSSDPAPSGASAINPSSSTSASTSASASASGSAAATPTAKPTVLANLDQIKVAGAVGKLPVVTGPWPLTTAETQSKVLVAGKGTTVSRTAIVEVNYIGINARTGKSFDQSFSAGKTASFQLDQVVAGFAKGLQGKKVGDRVLILMPSKDGYADGNTNAGIEKGDGLVFVVDIEGASLDRVTGDAVAPPAGMPTVKDNGNQAPTITIGSATKPTRTTSAVLIKGAGRAVAATDSVQVQYTCVNWDTGDVVAETWSTGAASGALSSLIPAWQSQLVGKTVGSRVLIVATPADAYPKGNATPSVAAGATLVYVVDLLFASAAQ